jgi:gliding motility-associated-like protein
VLDANGCTATLPASVIAPPPFEIIVEPRIDILFGDSIQINTEVSVPISELADVFWKPSYGLSCDTCLNPIAKPFTSVQYNITATNLAGCKATARVLLVVDKELNIYIPNIFSPDGDNENDVFMIFSDDRSVVKIKSFQIFSRWGELVSEHYDFLPNDPAYGWDGKHRGQDMNPAVFVWYAVIELVDGQEVLYEGDVTLMR